MHRRTSSRRIAIPVCAGFLLIASSHWASAQEPIQGTDAGRAIKELTTEIRSLRTAIEHGSQTQLQGQVLGLYLALQQNRVEHATARLDDVRRELEGITARAREVAQQIASLESNLAVESDATKRREMEMAQRATKQESDRIAAQEQQIKNRETDAYQAVQTEEARWVDLISRLEQLLKK